MGIAGPGSIAAKYTQLSAYQVIFNYFPNLSIQNKSSYFIQSASLSVICSFNLILELYAISPLKLEIKKKQNGLSLLQLIQSSHQYILMLTNHS